MGGLTRLLEGKLKLKVNWRRVLWLDRGSGSSLGSALQTEAAEAQNRAQSKNPVRGSESES